MYAVLTVGPRIRAAVPAAPRIFLRFKTILNFFLFYGLFKTESISFLKSMSDPSLSDIERLCPNVFNISLVTCIIYFL